MKVLFMLKTFSLLMGLVWSGMVWAQTSAHQKQIVGPSPGKRSAVSNSSQNAALARAAAQATAAVQAQAIADAAAAAVAAHRAASVLSPSLQASSVVLPLELPSAAFAPVAKAVSTSLSTDLNSEEMVIAESIHQGLIPCELGASVRLQADAAKPGYFNVWGKNFRYHMHPVRTSTGAIRLEDKKAGAVWLQLANKSMLMDQVKGRRVADECTHPSQVAYAQSVKHTPPPALFDSTGMGRPQN